MTSVHPPSGSQEQPALRTERLCRVVGGRRLIDEMSVAVFPREVVAVVGPSGAGKSSFLRLLNRLDEPSSGTVYLDGLDYRRIPPRELRRRVGMVMQTPHLFAGTVADNVAYGPAQRGEPPSPAEVRRLLERVGLPDMAERDTANLSGGEAQRVSLARTLANSPEVLLLDEPTSALDEATRAGIERLLLDVIRERGLTCLIVTHDVAQAERLAERIMVVEEGRLAVIGPAEEVARARRHLH